MSIGLNEEITLYGLGHRKIAGVDESGMGCFAGRVYVAAVILPPNINYSLLLPGINDSKKKSSAQREKLYDLVVKCSVDYAIGTASVEEIDDINIYWARFLAARRALNSLSVKPDYIIIDGNKEIPEIDTPQHAIVKGDQKSVSIAAASILAKVRRDIHINGLSRFVHGDYGWTGNKSYYCKAQIDAIKKHGKTKWHREKYVSKYLLDE